MIEPRSGYTLPVFACAAAKAAYYCLEKDQREDFVEIDLIKPQEKVSITVEQVAKLSDRTALAITRSDPGDNLDLTRNTPIWALVERLTTANEAVTIIGGEGIGKLVNQSGKAAIYRYAEELLKTNLEACLSPEEYIQVTIILPFGRQLATRTSNAAFGVVEGLSLLGTTGISQPLSAPDQLELYKEELAAIGANSSCLMFCIGENGLSLARQLGVKPGQMIKTANWLGPMLATASLEGISSLLLFGYHGKLIKLAGGIFHTHHFLADARIEILTANLASLGAPHQLIEQVFDADTCEAALNILKLEDRQRETNWVESLYQAIASSIDKRSQAYIYKQTAKSVTVGCILFDSQRNIIIKSSQGQTIFSQLIQGN